MYYHLLVAKVDAIAKRMIARKYAGLPYRGNLLAMIAPPIPIINQIAIFTLIQRGHGSPCPTPRRAINPIPPTRVRSVPMPVRTLIRRLLTPKKLIDNPVKRMMIDVRWTVL